MRPALPILCLMLLAGCSGDPDAVGDEADEGTLPTSSGPVVPAEPTVEVIAFSFDGNLGTFVHGCVFPVGTCQGAAAVEDVTDLYIERPGADLTALTFEMTWQAQSAATQDLWVGAMVMASCEGCNDTTFTDAHGTSPVRVDVQGVSVPLTMDALVHIYVYNPTLFVYDPAVPAYAGASVDQPFHIEGTATLSVPAS